jgi:hypothetical protein
MEILFGEDIPLSKLYDALVGRTMDGIFEAGTGLVGTRGLIMRA